MSDFSATYILLGPHIANLLSILVVYMIPSLFFLVIGMAFVQSLLQKQGCWQTFMAAGFAALGVAYLYYCANHHEACAYMMAAAMVSISFSVIISVRKH